MQSFKDSLNIFCMWLSFGLMLLGIIVFTTNYKSPEKIDISSHAVYLEGKFCKVSMPFNREVINISNDLADCLNKHALAINKTLEK